MITAKDLKLIILFGSKAKGKAGAISDTDVAVLADRPILFEEKIKLIGEIASEFGFLEDTIDLVDVSAAAPLLQQEIAKTGKLIAGKESDFIRFKVLAWKRYQDTAKFRRAREYSLAKQYAKQ